MVNATLHSVNADSRSLAFHRRVVSGKGMVTACREMLGSERNGLNRVGSGRPMHSSGQRLRNIP
jgi:hypothetical protein